MTDWPPRTELCAFVQAQLRKPVPEGMSVNGALVAALREHWPHLDAHTAYHLAQLGQRTDWAPEPRPEPKTPRRPKDALIPPVTLNSILATGARHLVTHCRRCAHHAPVPIAPLVTRFGGEASLDSILPLFVCRWCDGRADRFADDRPLGPGMGKRLL